MHYLPLLTFSTFYFPFVLISLQSHHSHLASHFSASKSNRLLSCIPNSLSFTIISTFCIFLLPYDLFQTCTFHLGYCNISEYSFCFYSSGLQIYWITHYLGEMFKPQMMPSSFSLLRKLAWEGNSKSQN